jgi:hypothetical protein
MTRFISACLFVWFIYIAISINHYYSNVSYKKQFLGAKMLYGQDTLTIASYCPVSDTFSLNDSHVTQVDLWEINRHLIKEQP